MTRKDRPTEGRRQPALRLVRRLLWLAIPLALAGELGHQVLARLRQELAHHWFHIVFGVGAGVIFAIYVAFDVRRHGWPQLQLRSRAPRSPRSDG